MLLQGLEEPSIAKDPAFVMAYHSFLLGESGQLLFLQMHTHIPSRTYRGSCLLQLTLHGRGPNILSRQERSCWGLPDDKVTTSYSCRCG